MDFSLNLVHIPIIGHKKLDLHDHDIDAMTLKSQQDFGPINDSPTAGWKRPYQSQVLQLYFEYQMKPSEMELYFIYDVFIFIIYFHQTLQ